MFVLPAKRLTFIKRAGLSGTFVTGALKQPNLEIQYKVVENCGW